VNVRGALSLSILTLFVWSAPTVAFAAEDASGVAGIETLRTTLEEQRENVRAISARLSGAKGDDLAALEASVLEERLAVLSTLGELVDAVLALEKEGGDASAYRAEVEARFGGLVSQVETALDEAQQIFDQIEAQREGAAPEARLAIEQQLRRQSALIGRVLAAGIDVVGMMDRLGLDASAAREAFTARLTDRAVLIAGRVELMGVQRADAEARQAQAPDDAGIKAELQALTSRIESDTEQLAKQIPLMEELGLETARYKQLLIASTGQITTDVFDAEVAQGLLAGWRDQVTESLIENGPGFLFKTLIFLAVLLVFWMLSRFVRKVVARAVEAPHLRFSQLLKRMIVSVASGSVIVLGLLLALSQLGVQVGPLLAGLGIAGFIVGFALQDTLANFAAGIMILLYRPYDVGDLIECSGDVFGEVSHMNLVSTTILTVDNRTRIVPNGKIWGDVITNLTAQTRRRVDLVFGISYTDDIEKAERILESIVSDHPKVLSDPKPVVKLFELGDSSVNFIVRPWATPADYWDVHWDVTREVKMRFDREGVSIPFPQRDVHFYPTEPAPEASSE
jgi:small conductance mechanosensitive channel